MMDNRYFVDYSTKTDRFESGQLQQSAVQPELRVSTEHFFETLSVKRGYNQLSHRGPTACILVTLMVLFAVGVTLVIVSAVYQKKGNDRLNNYYNALNQDQNDTYVDPSTNNTNPLANNSTPAANNTAAGTNNTVPSVTNNTAPVSNNTAAPNTTSSPNVTANSTPNAASNSTPSATPNTTSNTTSNTTPNATPNETSNGTSNATSGDSSNDNSNVTGNATENGTAQSTNATSANETNGTADSVRRLLQDDSDGTSNGTANYDDYYYGTLWLQVSNGTAVAAFIFGLNFFIVFIIFMIYTSGQKRLYFGLLNQETIDIAAFTARMGNRVSITPRHQRKLFGCCRCFWIMHFRHEVFFRDIEGGALATLAAPVPQDEPNPYLPLEDEGDLNATNNEDFETNERFRLNTYGLSKNADKEYI